MKTPTLYIFAGLPGSGKTTVSQALARCLGALHLRIDTIEQALRDLCSVEVQSEGYRLAYRLALDNLRLGTSVVADSCNPIGLTRREWEEVAATAGVPHVNIEVVCSDAREHRERVESRRSTGPDLELPTWEEVTNREYDPWTADRVIVDTSNRSEEECLAELLAKIGA
jgi:predicted kinase